MIFIILTVVAALIVLGSFVFFILDDGLIGALMGLIVGVIVGLVWLAVSFGLLAWATAVGTHFESDSQREELRALGSGSSVEGRSYFLGGGYIDGKRVLNYIVFRDGFSTLEQVNADESRIYEDEAESPYLEIKSFAVDVWWLMPGQPTVDTRYDFHIPADSILENYTIDNAAG